MSTVAKPNPVINQAPAKSAPAPVKRIVKESAPKKEYTLLFDRENYILMASGIALIFIGFMLMSGGKSPDPHKFNYDEIFSFRRITLAPIVVLLGFVTEVFAIMKKPKETESVNEAQA